MQQHALGVSYTSYKQVDLEGNDRGVQVLALSELSASKQKTNNFVGKPLA